MADHEHSDPGAVHLMEQSAARFNEQAGQAAIASMQNFINQQQSNHQASLRQSEEAATASFLQQVAAIEKIIRGS